MAMSLPMKRAKEAAPIPTRFGAEEVERMDRARAVLGLPSRSAFIRAAVLERIEAVEQTKIVEVRDVSEKEAMRLMDEYLQRHPGVHQVDEIADELGIELRVAFAAAKTLIDRGRARAKGG